jgi:hypothetical protein
MHVIYTVNGCRDIVKSMITAVMCFNSFVISPPQLTSDNVIRKGTHDYQNLPPHIESTTKNRVNYNFEMYECNCIYTCKT